MADKLTDLESRIAFLERIIFDSSLETKDDNATGTIVDKLTGINNNLNQAVSGSEKMKEAMKQVVSMSQFLDPSFLENLSAPLQAKYHVLELSAPVQEDRAKLLEQLKSMESVLDSEHIRNATNQGAQLAQLGLRQAQQAEAIQSHTAEVSDLLKTYSELVQALSKQMIYWDQTLTAAEKAKSGQ